MSTQIIQVLEELKTAPATCKEISAATNIKQSNIARYVRELEADGHIKLFGKQEPLTAGTRGNYLKQNIWALS